MQATTQAMCQASDNSRSRDMAKGPRRLATGLWINLLFRLKA